MESQPQGKKKGLTYTVADLFCGAGGLSLGFVRAGFKIIHAVDKNPSAVETYSLNFDHEACIESITWNSSLPRADVIIGGPPCQGFSSAGLRKPGDSRNTLVAVFAYLVAQHLPKAFVFENVEGFLTGDGGKWVIDLLSPLVKAGYCINLRKVNAANYGVPQHRKRVLVIGGLGWNPGFPEPTHKAFGAPGAHLHGNHLPPCPTVADAFHGLPPARCNGTHCDLDHTYRAPNQFDLARFQALKPGQTMKDLPEELWHATYRRRAYRRVMDGTPTERRGGAPAGIRRLEPDKPSKAITSGAISELVHPFEDRTLTIRECARLQTFPDTFLFRGSLTDKALLVGNAVPPRLAYAVAEYLYQKIQKSSELTSIPGLYEFTPTFSSGMSPALRRTVALVRETLSGISQPPTCEQLSLFGGH